MKIIIAENCIVETRVITTNVTPAGLAYYRVEYLVDNICIHAVGTGAMHGTPNPVALLDDLHTWNEYHYQDIDSPDPKPEGDDARNRKICSGSISGRPGWWEEKSKTHRQAILDACKQVVAAHASIMGRKGGSVKSPRKTATARDNGRKGGRPRK